MPHTSINSSSVVLKKEQDEYEVYFQPDQETTKFDKPIAEGETQDLYYGTEELLDALPKVWTRGVFYTLLGFAALALPWATLSKVDETGSARGRIEPKGATQKLDSQAGGSVKAVKVAEGDTVTTGQVLVELDSDILTTELQQAEAKLSALQNQAAQFDVLKNQLQLTLNIQKQQNQFQALEKMSQVNQAKQNLGFKQSMYDLQKLERQPFIKQVQQQIEIAQNDLQAAKNRLSIDSRQVSRFEKLVSDGAVSVNQVDQLKKEEQESKRLYAKAQSDVKQAELRLEEEMTRYQTTMNQLKSDIEQAKHKLAGEENSYQSLLQAGKLAILKYQEQLKELETQIANLQAEIAQTNGKIASINLQIQQRVVRSPVDGIIFELPVTKSGEVVQVGQRIADIAPQNTEMVLKANMPIQDSGFLKVGMPVKIKFDAYSFQEYGIVQGKVARISPDSKITQTPQGNIETYELEITLEQKYIQSGTKRIPLTPGQTANAEIIVRQRRVIDFVLDPFKKLHKNGLEL
ncbi:HlyD family efflux transporter periplasmic adaptor subunit [Umezakia ovalisporum]|uniref:HlyD family efflux transporter periplasmic adaptor subunit n=2 Tax=Umezakia ovalisporum TaxID=75695 RepID=A0AA43H193_9CYAN|nr:HlyD family efflux transporter periplasmic adaptor subunit [Umezakia ovalisporum]MDH6058503.1 HlyD family efflux transporter periplasmic adaptor subunit [Umezakia ovalisporum FSS-43]MDH6065380.1 HlyD family efflux transporter periplasmic adaptor subunit [Umezakia ovalisporum FSS-62]MDH6069426.1 HlyD family efflux transporter periplasmic adaptor subunit [Umezakia ovalisporum CobakiLakeA]MDH6075446.1 HlyD family efflux transporter periplasmic adaptor subunit [Umezakia ovalisporum CS-1034]MDH6